MDMAQLEQRLTRLEDLEAIKQLKARYCAIADEDHNPDKITTLFVEDGVWEGGFGIAQGHEAIRQLFQRAQQRFSFSHHMVMNPIIEVAANRAQGTWYFFGLFTVRETNEVRWLAVRYEEDYVKVNGAWKYQYLRVHGRMSASYETGWAPKD